MSADKSGDPDKKVKELLDEKEKVTKKILQSDKTF
jgi:hypothetical protein